MSLWRRIVERLPASPAGRRRLAQVLAAIRYDLSWRLARPGAFRQRFEHAIATMPQGICLYDAQDRLELVNEQFCKIYNQPMSRLRTGMRLYDILADSCAIGNYPGRSVDDIYSARKAFIDKREKGTFLQELGDGRLIAIYHQPLDDGGWVCTYEDITERRRAEAQIEFLAQHDGLTQLPNRLLFNARLDDALKKANDGVSCALLCLDLDGFKDVNDRLGHAAGDALLQEVATRLLKCVRKDDTAARLGGDEFAIVLPNASAAEAVKTAQRVTSALSGTHSLGAFGEAHIGVSIGIACAPEHATEADALMLLADKALYAAKHSGLGIPRLYDDQLERFTSGSPQESSAIRKGRSLSPAIEELRKVAALANDLRAALHDGHLHLCYQPIYDSMTRRPIAFEALARWTDPVRGSVSPAEFIPAAEESGFIGPLTEWVLLNACREAARWREPVQVSVNLSPLNLSQPALVATVERILAETGLPANRLVLELTEGLLLESSDTIQNCLRGLKQLGVELWLDDFGSGYANLGYLHRLSCDVVKIDRSFLMQHDKQREILGGMIALAQACGLRVAVEGVETANHHLLLQELGCDLLQGFLFARPMPPEQIDASLGLVAGLPFLDGAPIFA
ncbi:putative bifunctional diguanylate cyclase/phosphodiesterase [Bradyrhizobium canariense]|uniref:Diguanylate cyclase (GGDEF) domain-containing protein n=1 Tax=Bradyrhizobium canariense TaxID=255045 RepID=A0A1H1Y5D9_9BRAD|nr:EAL domain-containing protein [Bradyrhizobium canariense]SDT16631.1 diguanylate cyclase (GGDEF) domain-containing protein [Bradyrhizobium canariense]